MNSYAEISIQIERGLQSLVERGLLLSFTTTICFERDAIDARVRYTSGRQEIFTLTRHEVCMERDAVGQLSRVIHSNAELERIARYVPPSEFYRGAALNALHLPRIRQITERDIREMQVFVTSFLRAPDKEAEQKSKDLFRSVAGEDAFKKLESGQPIEITGSLGTAYLLYPRATYCVQRVKDGAKLCAVVPNVPLWDHLLGIKLTIERDEEKFLSVANVSGGIGSHTHTMAWSQVGIPNSWDVTTQSLISGTVIWDPNSGIINPYR